MEPFIIKMREENIPEPAIEVFLHFYRQLSDGRLSTIPESDLLPLRADEIESMDNLSQFESAGEKALSQTVVVKLNGGLGTTMGLQGPKSLIPVRYGLTFLDMTLEQINSCNARSTVPLPLVLMNSFFTDAATITALNSGKACHRESTRSFLQHKFPKVVCNGLQPATHPTNPILEWHPAGHGDLLLALETSGELPRLLDKGFRFLFVSNIDNLGATLDTGILGYFSDQNLDFLMEVTDRTPMDRKGGHLARHKTGRLVLREAAQCATEDKQFCADISRHPFFNTNNLWINLLAAQRIIREKKYLQTSCITNRKKLNPIDPDSPDVFHLESAIGSFITVFDASAALRVPRMRFAPVKDCEDLLLVWSDYYMVEENFRIVPNPRRLYEKVSLALDKKYFSRIDHVLERFPYGAPSLINCQSFSVTGDVKFGRNITLRGPVSITNTTDGQVRVPHNAVISGVTIY